MCCVVLCCGRLRSIWSALWNDFVLHIRRLEEPISRRTGNEKDAAFFLYIRLFHSVPALVFIGRVVCFFSCYFRALQIGVVLDSGGHSSTLIALSCPVLPRPDSIFVLNLGFLH